MKSSHYNKFFDSTEGIKLAYNCLSGGLATITEDKFSQIQKILSSPDDYAFDTDEKKELRQQLIEGRFLGEKRHELDLLKVRYHTARFNSDTFTLTILPTLDCNFGCTYCYEDRHAQPMTDEVKQAVVNIARRKSRRVRLLNVSWFGGEPLLDLDTISSLTEAFLRVCDENKCEYSAAIVTNGYLLDKPVAEKLAALKVVDAQITLDGPADIHDRRRPLKDGQPTFRTIIDNVEAIVDTIKGISIRINVDRENKDRVLELLDILDDRGLKGKVNVDFARVNPYTDVCANVEDSCLHAQEYTDHEVNLYRQSIEKGFFINRYPRPLTAYCSGVSDHSFVVDPKGKLYKCALVVGRPEGVVGDVFGSLDTRELNKWLAWNPLEKKGCRKCNILPICMGGCAYMARRQDSEAKGSCEDWRYNLTEMLDLYYSTTLKLDNPERKEVNANEVGSQSSAS